MYNEGCLHFQILTVDRLSHGFSQPIWSKLGHLHKKTSWLLLHKFDRYSVPPDMACVDLSGCLLHRQGHEMNSWSVRSLRTGRLLLAVVWQSGSMGLEGDRCSWSYIFSTGVGFYLWEQKYTHRYLTRHQTLNSLNESPASYPETITLWQIFIK